MTLWMTICFIVKPLEIRKGLVLTLSSLFQLQKNPNRMTVCFIVKPLETREGLDLASSSLFQLQK